MNLKAALADKLAPAELAQLRTSFDIIGTVAILEVPAALQKRERAIVAAVREQHPQLTAICAKAGARRGRLRLRALRLLDGNSTETVHKEHGCSYFLDARKVYFSPREATERLRVSGKVRSGEMVLVPFAGAGPFAILIAKRQPSATVVGIELNKDACDYFRENAFRNRVAERVSVLCGDFTKLAPSFFGSADRVIMPLPESGSRFLPQALRCLKPGGTVHFYAFEGEETGFAKSEKLVQAAAAKLGRTARVTGRTRVHLYGPRVWKVCVDAVIA